VFKSNETSPFPSNATNTCTLHRDGNLTPVYVAHKKLAIFNIKQPYGVDLADVSISENERNFVIYFW
jgi:hypothetical protein